jgi:hypothetical protein
MIKKQESPNKMLQLFVIPKSETTSRAWPGPFEEPPSYPQLCWWSLIPTHITKREPLKITDTVNLFSQVMNYTSYDENQMVNAENNTKILKSVTAI